MIIRRHLIPLLATLGVVLSRMIPARIRMGLVVLGTGLVHTVIRVGLDTGLVMDPGMGPVHTILTSQIPAYAPRLVTI